MQHTDSTIRMGTMISEFAHPAMPRVLNAAGFDFAIVDCEHGAFDVETVAAMAGVALGTNLDLWARVPRVSRDYIGRYLDAGISGIVAPMIDTVEQAAELVRLTHYPPAGARGISVTRAHSGYGVDNLAEYLELANQRVEVYAQIETRFALEQVEQIAAVEGLSGLIVGPNDLLGDLGMPGEYDRPELESAIRRVTAAAVNQGISAGIITGNHHLLAVAREHGANFMSVNSDIGYLLGAAKKELHLLRSGQSL